MIRAQGALPKLRTVDVSSNKEAGMEGLKRLGNALAKVTSADQNVTTLLLRECALDAPTLLHFLALFPNLDKIDFSRKEKLLPERGKCFLGPLWAPWVLWG